MQVHSCTLACCPDCETSQHLSACVESVAHVQVIDFYEYYEGLQEGWDGPALLVFTDGNKIGARLDRNGLRPARYWETDDGMVYVASEVGVLGDVLTNASHVVRKGRLGPGQMVCADLHEASRKAFLVWVAASYAHTFPITQGDLKAVHDTCILLLLMLNFSHYSLRADTASLHQLHIRLILVVSAGSHYACPKG